MRLTLRKETLAELRSEELAAVGAAGEIRGILSVEICLADPSDKIAVCDSLLRPCITHTCTR